MTKPTLCIVCGEPCPPVGNRVSANRRYCKDQCKNRHFAAKKRRTTYDWRQSQPTVPAEIPSPVEVPIQTQIAIEQLAFGTEKSVEVEGPLPLPLPNTWTVDNLEGNKFRITQN